MNEEEILKKYKLSESEHNHYYEIIKRIYTSGKIPVKNPIAVIIGGQTGAGKSGLIGYSTKIFTDANVIIINSDEIKPFHPKSEEIARLYPKLYTKITDHHNQTYYGMPNTIRYIEETGRYDILEVFARDERPDEPINIYAVHNPKSKEKIHQTICGKKYVSTRPRKYGFDDALDSILKSREEEYCTTIPTIENRIKVIMQSMSDRNASDEEMQMVLELMEDYQEIIKKKLSRPSRWEDDER